MKFRLPRRTWLLIALPILLCGAMWMFVPVRNSISVSGDYYVSRKIALRELSQLIQKYPLKNHLIVIYEISDDKIIYKTESEMSFDRRTQMLTLTHFSQLYGNSTKAIEFQTTPDAIKLAVQKGYIPSEGREEFFFEPRPK